MNNHEESVPGQAESRLKRSELHRWLAERQAKDASMPVWLELYDALIEERDDAGNLRWDWRKALYIAWSCVPKDERDPKTLGGLANRLGVRTSTIRKWRLHDPEITRRIAELPRTMLLDHATDVFDALVKVAANPDPRSFQDRRLFLEMIGEYRPSGTLAVDGTLGLEHSGTRAVDLSDDQLAAIAIAFRGSSGTPEQADSPR